MQEKKTEWYVNGERADCWESFLRKNVCLSKKTAEEQRVQSKVVKANGDVYRYDISSVYEEEFKESAYRTEKGLRIVADCTVERSNGTCQTFYDLEFWAGIGEQSDGLAAYGKYMLSYTENLYDVHKGVQYLKERYDRNASGYRGRFHEQGVLALRPSQIQTEGLFFVKGQVGNCKVDLHPQGNIGYALETENVIRLVKLFEGTIDENGEVKTGWFYYFMDEDGKEGYHSYKVDITENGVFKGIEFSDPKYGFYRGHCQVMRCDYVPEKKALLIPAGMKWGGDWSDATKDSEDFCVTSLEEQYLPIYEEFFNRDGWSGGRRCENVLSHLIMPSRLRLNNGVELKAEGDGYYTSADEQMGEMTVFVPLAWEMHDYSKVGYLTPTSTSLLRPNLNRAYLPYEKENGKIRYRYTCEVAGQKQEIYLSFAPGESLRHNYQNEKVVSFQTVTKRCAALIEETKGVLENYIDMFGTEADAARLKMLMSKYLLVHDEGESILEAWNRLNAKELLEGLEQFCELVAENLVESKEEENEEALKENVMLRCLPEAFMKRQNIDRKNVSVYEQLAYAYEDFIENGEKVPDLAIMGAPGSGKTSLVKELGRYLFGKKVKICTPSELKGAYVGHTRKVLLNLIEEVYESDKILVIDEAYDIYNDEFGKEAMTVLLPIMSGDQCEFEWVDDITDRNKAVEKKLVIEPDRKVTIWFLGYEHKMRKMLSKNPGLFRRMTRLTLPTPQVSTLYSTLLKNVDKSLKKFIEEHVGKEVNNFIGWATGRDFSEYFANYAGIKSFTRDVRYLWKQINTDEFDDGAKKKEFIGFFDSKRKEINDQYKAVLLEQNKSEFQVEIDCTATLDSVKGYKTVCDRIRVIADMLSRYEVYESQGIDTPKGTLLVGPPGTGKTHIARALAGEVQKRYNDGEDKEKRVAFIAVAATEIMMQEKVKALFEQAREYDTCILFIDEIDAIGKQRRASYTESALIQLMKEMDGFNQGSRIYVLAATNAPESLDPALKRPGRFDEVMKMELPDKEDRRTLLEAFLERNSLWKELSEEEISKGEVVETVARLTIGFSAAELKALANEAAIEYYTAQKEGIKAFEDALLEMVDRRLVGERQKKDNTEDAEQEKSAMKSGERKNTGSFAIAAHEVGHALVNILENGEEEEPFEKITIIPRGQALGFVMRKPKEEPMMTKSEMLSRIRVCMGGRVAEEIIFGEENISAGAVQDICQATEIAMSMVFDYGMCEEIGPMALRRRTNDYLESSVAYLCSDNLRNRAENKVQELLKEEMEKTKKMLEERKDVMEKLSELVVEKETMSGEAFLAEYKKLVDDVK